MAALTQAELESRGWTFSTTLEDVPPRPPEPTPVYSATKRFEDRGIVATPTDPGIEVVLAEASRVEDEEASKLALVEQQAALEDAVAASTVEFEGLAKAKFLGAEYDAARFKELAAFLTLNNVDPASLEYAVQNAALGREVA